MCRNVKAQSGCPADQYMTTGRSRENFCARMTALVLSDMNLSIPKKEVYCALTGEAVCQGLQHATKAGQWQHHWSARCAKAVEDLLQGDPGQ